MQALASPSPRPSAIQPSVGAASACRRGDTPLFRDYQAAFEGATGLSLNLIEVPPGLAFTNRHAITRRREPPAGDTRGAGVMISYVPVPFGRTVGACLQLGPFIWRAEEGSNGTTDRTVSPRAIDRREHRSVLRLLGVFALHLAEESEGLLLGEHSSQPPFVEAARAYIAAHLAEAQLALTTVAAAVDVSPYYFCKRFYESTGLHFTEYVNRSRVARVKARLLNPHVHVSEAAYEAGFQSLSQFNRAFRRVVGEAPSDYRHRLHARPHPSSAVSHRACPVSTLQPTLA